MKDFLKGCMELLLIILLLCALALIMIPANNDYTCRKNGAEYMKQNPEMCRREIERQKND
jgi:uncharacterized protein YneF (UPF0154 family)